MRTGNLNHNTCRKFCLG